MVTGEFPIQMQWGKEGSVLIQVVNILDFHNTSGSGHLHLHLGFNLYACLPRGSYGDGSVTKYKSFCLLSRTPAWPRHDIAMTTQQGKNKQKS